MTALLFYGCPIEEVDRTNMLRAGHWIILLVLSLLMLGVLMVNSAGLSVSADTDITAASLLLGREAHYAALAALALLLGSRVPVLRLYALKGMKNPAPWVLLGCILLLTAVYVPGLGHEVNGARRWIRIADVGFQPSELTKWGLVFVMAWYIARHADTMHRFRTGIMVPLFLVATCCALMITEDLGTCILIAATCMFMLLAGGARLGHLLATAPAGLAACVAAIAASPYRMSRLLAFIHPYDDPEGRGFHVLGSLSTISGGGLTGRGLGNGLLKYGYLPEDRTDFIFAVICDELGIAGALLVILLLAALLACCYVITRQTTHLFSRLLGMGIMCTIAFQASINLLVVTGLAPTKGIALPLVSMGGTGWCLTAFFLGLLLSIDRDYARSAPCPANHAIHRESPIAPPPL